LTGARESLKMSLHLYKENINARNLLGLVYYAMGESAEGLKEWVLSKNLSEKNNIADRFINTMKRNMHDLDSEDHGIRKYNQALGYAQNGARDLATIQLKKVVAVHTNMVKAYELLALLYMADGKYDQARKALTQCLQVDHGNTSAMYYMKELNQMSRQGAARNIGTVGENDREQLIIPVRFRDFGTYLSNALYIALGLAIGIAIAWFVVVPGRVQKETGDAVAQARSYEEEISNLTQELTVKDQEIANLSESLAEAEKKAAEVPETSPSEPEPEEPEEETNTAVALRKDLYNTGWSANQKAILAAVDDWNSGQITDMVQKFFTIDPEMVSEAYQPHYRELLIIIENEGVYNNILAMASDAVTRESYEEAAAYYDAAALLHPESDEMCYRSGLCYEALGDVNGAADRYYLTVNLFPDSQYLMDAYNRYCALKETDSVPGLPRGVDAEELTKPVDTGELLYLMTGEVPGQETPEEQPPAAEEGEVHEEE
ncbi:MAG: tetratricopeptide repeat protein, partial [Lachnospiraceae bacterium]|nr:tetratricopeptide repeat protein [Lachnospiraceae bacterium]